MDDRGVSSNLAFIIASGILLASISSIYTETAQLGDQSTVRAGEQANLQSEAQGLAHLLLRTEGLANDGTGFVPWNATHPYTDAVERLGLLEPNTTLISFEKMRNLRLAGFTANDTDGRVNYEEAAADLGLNAKRLGFHVRAKPSLSSVEELLGTGQKDPNLKVSYIANVSKDDEAPLEGEIAEGIVLNAPRCETSPVDPRLGRFAVTAKNGGTEPTQFFAVVDYFSHFDGDEEGEKISRQTQTYLIPASGTAALYVDLEATAGFACDADSYAIVELWDISNQLVRQGFSNISTNWSVAPDEAAGELYVELDHQFYANGNEAVVRYLGDLTAKDDSMWFHVRAGTDPAGAIVHQEFLDAPKQLHKRDFSFTVGLPEGQYTAYVTNLDKADMTQSQPLLVENDPISAYEPPGGIPGPLGPDDQFTFVLGPSVAAEVEMLNQLMEKFCPFFFSSKTSSPMAVPPTWNLRCSEFKQNTGAGQLVGDIYPDLKDDLSQLVTQLEYPGTETPRYDYVNVLVVGSDVAHNSMTSGTFKWPLQRWVDGGGTLIVFGSPDKSTNWLNPVFGIKETSSSGGLSTPDVDHPLLNTPDRLAYDLYDSSGKGWDTKAKSEDSFTDIVKEGEVPVTVVSDPGAFGEGTIILTTWRPYDLFVDGSNAGEESLMMMNNFLMQGYQDLFLDYGPPIPAGVPAIPSVEFSSVVHPQIGPVSLTLTVYVFPYS